MATKEVNDISLQDYYLPENNQDANSATCSAFIMFSVFALICITLVSYFM